MGGVGIASSIFQSILDKELRKRIHGPDSEQVNDPDPLTTMKSTKVLLQMIRAIRHSSKLVANLEPELQRKARDSYAIALRAVFIFAACATLLAFIVRLPVRL